MAETLQIDNDTELGGSLPQPIDSCLSVMDILMKQNSTIVSSMIVSKKTNTTAATTKSSLQEEVGIILGKGLKYKIIVSCAPTVRVSLRSLWCTLSCSLGTSLSAFNYHFYNFQV